ncbi:hypothetical protein F5Y09DRAFT_348044 [Xylaria sp. FL1042]|nr:hypothetical protein F5Y09DRAFT_348044 [Xylaria sp. FL1042]
MTPTNPTTSTHTTMGAKLVGVLENRTRPTRPWYVCKKIGNDKGRSGVSDPTRCVFLADDGSLKWVAVNAGVFPGAWSLSPKKASRLVFPPFPAGNWNLGQIRRLEDGEVGFSQTFKVPIKGISKKCCSWHPTKIEFNELEDITYTDKRLDGRIFNAKHPLFEGKNLFVKIDPWSSYCAKKAMATETKAYQLLEGLEIAPKFLGHVTCDGAIIGFILEMVEGAQTTKKEDESARIEAVKKLHAVGITHGCAHHGNFLKVGQDKMLIIDFEESKFGEKATRKRMDADILRIGDFDNDYYGPIDDDSDDSWLGMHNGLHHGSLFDDLEDDEINWTDDSEAAESDSEGKDSSCMCPKCDPDKSSDEVYFSANED